MSIYNKTTLLITKLPAQVPSYEEWLENFSWVLVNLFRTFQAKYASLRHRYALRDIEIQEFCRWVFRMSSKNLLT